MLLSFEKERPREKREKENFFFPFNLQKTEKRKTFVLPLVWTLLSSFAWLIFFFHHSLLLAWWRAIRKHLPVLFLFLTVALHISHTYRHTHIHTLLGHRRQVLHCSNDELSATSCAYFPLVTLKVASFVTRPPRHLLPATQTYTRRTTRVAICYLYASNRHA